MAFHVVSRGFKGFEHRSPCCFETSQAIQVCKEALERVKPRLDQKREVRCMKWLLISPFWSRCIEF